MRSLHFTIKLPIKKKHKIFYENLIPSSNTEIPRQMNGEQKINLSRTSNAQNTCVHDVLDI